MKTNTFIRSITFTALLAVAALPMACKTTEGHDRAEATAEKVVNVGGVAGQTQLRLDNTLAALEKVVATAKQDPKPAFESFVKELGEFKGEFADLSKQRASLKAEAESWFMEYEKKNGAISDEDMRKAGTERLADYREQVGDISKQVDELMTGCNAVSARLDDVRLFLGNDLTAKGIDAASGKISDCVKDGRKVASGLGKLSKSSTELASKFRANRM